MSRSGYDYWSCGSDASLYRANMDRAIAGKRGQAMLLALRDALDAMPEKDLVAGSFEEDGVCALGALGRKRGLDMSEWDKAAAVDDSDYLAGLLAKAFNIPMMLAREVMYENDEGGPYWDDETPAQRFDRMRRWITSQIRGAQL